MGHGENIGATDIYVQVCGRVFSSLGRAHPGVALLGRMEGCGLVISREDSGELLCPSASTAHNGCEAARWPGSASLPQLPALTFSQHTSSFPAPQCSPEIHPLSLPSAHTCPPASSAYPSSNKQSRKHQRLAVLRCLSRLCCPSTSRPSHWSAAAWGAEPLPPPPSRETSGGDTDSADRLLALQSFFFF